MSIKTLEINHLTIEKGTDFQYTFTRLDDSINWLGITSSSFKIGKNYNPSKSLSFIVGINTTNKSITISMASSTTMLLANGRNNFDGIITISGLKEKPVKGTIIVNETVL